MNWYFEFLENLSRNIKGILIFFIILSLLIAPVLLANIYSIWWWIAYLPLAIFIISKFRL